MSSESIIHSKDLPDVETGAIPNPIVPPADLVATPPPAPDSHPSHDAIARLAYSLWESRSGETGSPEEDWLAAEAELKGRG